MDFFEHQHHAKKKTKQLVFYFVLAVVLIIAVINTVVFFLGNNSGQFQLTAKQFLLSPWFAAISLGTIIVIILGSLIRGFQISGGGKSVAKMVNARPVKLNSKDRLERRFINVVEEMSIASGMPVPTLYIMDDEMGMNAFVAGLVPSDTVMVVTQGLLENLNRQELQGVVAHEFSHIFNADMRLNVRLIAILGGILALGQLGYFLLRTMRYSGHRRSSSNSNNQMGIVLLGSGVALLVVGYIGLFFGRLIKAAISRQREFLADASAVQYSRDSMGIANALYRIKTNGKGSLLDSSHAEDMSHMCFGSALKFTAFSGLLATHPPLDERIKTLVPGYKPPKSTSTESHAEVAQSSASETASNFAGPQAATDNAHPVIANDSDGDALEILSPEALINSIGQVQSGQLAQAKIIYQELPNELIDAAHENDRASLVILAMIVSGSDIATFKVDELIDSVGNRLTDDDKKRLKIYVLIINQLKQHLKLPLIELTIPTLKQLSDEDKKNLLACSSLLMSADHKIEPFEFFLYALLRKHLSHKDASFSSKTIKKYKPLLSDIQYLIAILGQASEHFDTKILANTMKSFDAAWTVPGTLPSYNANLLNKALQRLNQLTPLLKRPLMQTLAEIIQQDGQINTTEIELLRAVAIYLECPIPTLVVSQ